MRYEMAPNQRQQHIIGGVDPDYVTYSCVSPKVSPNPACPVKEGFEILSGERERGGDDILEAPVLNGDDIRSIHNRSRHPSLRGSLPCLR